MSTDDALQQALKLHLAGDIAAASRAYRRILAAHPKHADALHLLGLTHIQSGRPGAAVPLIEKAIAVNPGLAAFHGNLGTAFLALGKLTEARRAYERAVAIHPGYVDGWRNLGSLCARSDDHVAAADAYERLSQLAGGHDGHALGYLSLSLAVMCEWDRLDGVREPLLAALRTSNAEASPVPPFALVAYDLSPEEWRRAGDRAAAFIKRRALGPQGRAARHQPRPRPDRLRIGYLSEDFHEHATAYLIGEMLEAHDRTRFTTFAYSYGPRDGGAARRRVAAAVDQLVEIGALSPAQAAQRMLDDRIDILVDLKGHTGLARTDILAWRPAPLTIAYLGFPGTFGGDFVDYILADRFVIPEAEEANYSERVICLPHCYQANDSRRPRPAARPAKSACGLPEDAIVLCVFNNSFKIGRAICQAWLDLLAAHPRTILWFIDCHPVAGANLRRAASERGIAADRLVFAPRLPHEQHMMRIGAADLFLDTYPCGGHTTASDALWTGVPVITLAGRTFASRVAGSLLSALGLGELVTGDLASYGALASRLIGDPEELGALRARLVERTIASPVFDGRRIARDIEAAYDRAWETFAAGRAPQGFALDAREP